MLVMMGRRTAMIGAIVVIAVTTVGCSSARSFSALAADAEAVPVPAGVTFVSQARALNDGPGFTTTKSEQVTRQYSTNLECGPLQDSWARALQGAHRHFRIANSPHSYGAVGSLGIVLNDRPERLGVTLGTDDGHCAMPLVYAFNPPH